MRRAQLRSTSFWLTFAGSTLIVALLLLQFVEAGHRGTRRIGIDIDEESAQLHVSKVERPSPAGTAGMRIGDRLVAIEGSPLSVIEDYDRVAGTFRRGPPITVVVERDGRVHALEVFPGMAVPWWIYLERGFVSALCLFVGILGLVVRPGDLRARLLAWVFFLIAFEFALPQGLGIDSPWNLLSPIFFYVVTGSQIALELHLALVLPRPDAWPGRRRKAIGAAYLSGLLVAAVGTTTYLLEWSGSSPLPFSLEDVDEFIHQIVLPAWAIGVLGLLMHATVRAPARRGRLQSALILLGVLPWALYILAGWTSGYPDRLPSQAWESIVPLLMLFYPVAVFVAISRYQLLDLEVVVRRGWVYSTLTAVLVGLFYGTLGVGTGLFSRFLGSGPGSIGSLAITTVVLGLVFSPLRRALQLLIDRRFFPEREAMRRRLIQLAGDLPTLRGPEGRGQHLTHELRAIFRASFATILIANPDEATVSPLASSGDADASDLHGLEFHDGWIDRLRRAGKPVNASRLMPESTQDQPPGRAPRIAVPLRVDRRLVAVLLLGDKSAGTRYSKEEVELLGLLAHHVAVAFDNARLFHSATYETLTGLLRREAILELLSREIERARRHGRPLSVALVDVDHFKRINDRFGHLEGDRVLQQVARKLSSQLRGTDAVGRYGGEEFLLVLPETDLSAGAALSDALRCSIERMELTSAGSEPMPVRISVGVATLQDARLSGHDTIPELLGSADRRLYRAKAAGRNRVEPRSGDVTPDPNRTTADVAAQELPSLSG